MNETLAEIRREAAGHRRGVAPEDDGRIHLSVSSYSLFVHDTQSGQVVPYTTARLIDMAKLPDCQSAAEKAAILRRKAVEEIHRAARRIVQDQGRGDELAHAVSVDLGAAVRLVIQNLLRYLAGMTRVGVSARLRRARAGTASAVSWEHAEGET